MVFGVCVLPDVAAGVALGVVVEFEDEVVVELVAFFLAFVVELDCEEDAVCAEAIDPAIKNALTQKLAANFRYRFIDSS